METITTVSMLYEDLPVLITDKDIEEFTGLNLQNVIVGDSNVKIRAFLDTVHKQIYHFLIYSTGSEDIKNAIITKYITRLEKPLKIALLTQAQYLLSNGNIELFNGVIKSVSGTEFKETADVISKIIAPSVINILIGTKPNILYAGE